VLVVAMVCVVGLALAAATVSTPTSAPSGEGPGVGPGGADDPGERGEPASEPGGGGLPDILLYAGAVIFAITALIALSLLAKTLNLRTIVVAAVAVAIIVIVGSLLLSAILELDMDSSAEWEEAPSATSEPGGGDGGDGGSGRTPVETPTQNTDVPIALLGVFGVFVLLLVVAIYRYSGTDVDVDTLQAANEEETTTDGVQAVGEAAGRAAERLGSDAETTENTIYRAWREMTDALEVDQPRTTTPEEFAAVAIDAGMGPDDVRELTWLFEEVRYGDVAVTDEREQRAMAALRRIQETYAGGETDV
jgi:hypothetical protein